MNDESAAPRAYVLEDDPDIAQLVLRFLEKGGNELPHQRGRPPRARAIAGQRADLVVLDLMLPR